MSAAISTTFGTGGSGLAPKGTSTPTLATALRAAATDLAGLQIATVTTADATDLATALTLVNDLKAKINAQAAYTITLTAA